MRDDRIGEILRMMDPPPRERLWYGGATPVGCLRGVAARKASWRPAGDRKTIWEIALHVAYWKYDVRRKLLDLLFGVILHDVHPVGQIQMMKRLAP